MPSTNRIAIAATLLVASAYCAAAGAFDEISERYCSAIAPDSISIGKGPVPLVSLHVLAETEKPGPFVLPPEAPRNTRLLTCYRSSVLPAPNDYKVALARLDLTIVDDTAGRSRVASLYFAHGHIGFKMVTGSLTDLESRELKDRLAALTAAAKLASDHGSN
jgi:hypothetical protein